MNYRQEISDKCLIKLFNSTFYKPYNTQLLGGGQEPEYIPANQEVKYHRIIFTHDYIASALHEIAHWCIAGEQRRQQHDYGYWYIPDGRTECEQADFERVESKSQALEWIFTRAIGRRFRVSIDNLDNITSRYNGPSDHFKHNIVDCAKGYCEGGLNDRALAWITVLGGECSRSFDISDCLATEHYCFDALS